MIKVKSILTAIAGCMLFSVGCASHAPQTGFLSSYQNLEANGSAGMKYVGPKLGQYSSFMLDPVEVHFYDGEAARNISNEDIARLESFFYDQVQQNLSASYPIVTTPGPGVGRIRIAITNLKPGTPALNVIPQTKLTGLGLGAASGEVEIIDSVSGEQIAAGIETQTGSRLSLSGLAKWGDAEAVMKDWSQRIVAAIVAAHGS
jgi:Protein of unknown function (DUF3313)